MVRGMPKKRVLLVDDNAVVRIALGRLFNSHPGFEVVGEAEHGREAIDKGSNSETRPDRLRPVDARDERPGSGTAADQDPAQCVAHTIHGLRRPRSAAAITCRRHTRRCSERAKQHPLDPAGRIAGLSNVKHC